MSDHSKPRRWTVPLGYLDRLGAGMTEEATKPTAVREDCITTADVEAVARHLAERDHGGPLTGAPICTGYKDEAALLLAHIFEGGEQS